MYENNFNNVAKYCIFDKTIDEVVMKSRKVV